MGQGKANIQILCCECSAGASLRLESEHLSGNILQERKVMPAWSASSLASPGNSFQSLKLCSGHAQQQKEKEKKKNTIPLLKEKFSKTGFFSKPGFGLLDNPKFVIKKKTA